MKKKVVFTNKIKVESFVTNLPEDASKNVKGGWFQAGFSEGYCTLGPSAIHHC